MADQKQIPNSIRFLFGGLSGYLFQAEYCTCTWLILLICFFRMAATCVVQPMDLIKNRMQLSGEGGKVKEHRNTLHAIRSIMMNEGISGMYSGLSAGLLRQATYTTTRLGIYTYLFEKAKR